MYNIICEMSCQSRFNARYWMLGAGALGRPRRMVWGGRREEGSGWETHVYLWQIHFDIWQNQYNIVKLNKIKKTRNETDLSIDYVSSDWIRAVFPLTFKTLIIQFPQGHVTSFLFWMCCSCIYSKQYQQLGSTMCLG